MAKGAEKGAGKRVEQEAENGNHGQDAGSSTTRRRNRKGKGPGWGEWMGRYTTVKVETDEPVYIVQLGKN